MSVAAIQGDRVYEIPRRVSPERFRALAPLLADLGVRITYLDGRLLLAIPSPRHVGLARRLDRIIVEAADVLDIPWTDTGDILFPGLEGREGKMPDASYYLGENAGRYHERVLSQETIFPAMPRPDIAVEVVVSNVDPIARETYARLGVPELWWYEGGLSFLRLEGGRYVEVDASTVLPEVTLKLVEECLETSGVGRNWVRAVRRAIRRGLGRAGR